MFLSDVAELIWYKLTCMQDGILYYKGFGNNVEILWKQTKAFFYSTVSAYHRAEWGESARTNPILVFKKL